MGVENVTEEWTDTTFTEAVEGRGAAVRSFKVVFDRAEKHIERTACRASGIPRRDSRHPKDTTLVVTSLMGRRIGPAVCQVMAIYGPAETAGIQPTGAAGGPAWQREEWGFRVENVLLDTEINGNPIVNSADEPFDPPITEDLYDLVCTIVRTEATFDHQEAVRYANGMNSDEWRGHAVGTCRLIRTGRRTGANSWQVTNRIIIRTGGWEKRPMDRGWRERDEGLDKVGRQNTHEIVSGNNEMPTSPYFLDGNGKRVKGGEAKVRLEFLTLEYLAFGKFNL